MARRATYFFDVHKTKAPRLLVSGAWEYMRPGRSTPVSALMSISAALDVMHYDVGLLSAEEARLLEHHDIMPPSWQQTASAAPFSVVTTTAGDRVGFLRFPTLPQDTDVPSKELIQKLSRDVQKYRKDVRLLIGLSDWGWLGEQGYLRSNPKTVPDFLFGSGMGSGVNGRMQADGRCVWVRTYDKGRTIPEITIYEWPDRKNSFAWDQGKNYKTTSNGLHDSIKDYPAVQAVLQ